MLVVPEPVEELALWRIRSLGEHFDPLRGQDPLQLCRHFLEPSPCREQGKSTPLCKLEEGFEFFRQFPGEERQARRGGRAEGTGGSRTRRSCCQRPPAGCGADPGRHA